MDSSLAARAFIQLIINAAVAVATRRVLTVVICCDARLRAGSRSSVRALFASLKVAVHRACACVRRSGGQGAGAFLKFCLFFFFTDLVLLQFTRLVNAGAGRLGVPTVTRVDVRCPLVVPYEGV